MGLKLNERPDGFAFLFGEYTTPKGERIRMDIMPPIAHWNGDLKMTELGPHATDWVVYADGEEIARVREKDALDRAVDQRLAIGGR